MTDISSKAKSKYFTANEHFEQPDQTTDNTVTNIVDVNAGRTPSLYTSEEEEGVGDGSRLDEVWESLKADFFDKIELVADAHEKDAGTVFQSIAESLGTNTFTLALMLIVPMCVLFALFATKFGSR